MLPLYRDIDFGCTMMSFSLKILLQRKREGKGGASSRQQFLLTSPLQVKYQTNYLAEARKYLEIQKCEKSSSRKIGLAVFRGGCNWGLLIGTISGWRVAERGDIYSNILFLLNWLPNPAKAMTRLPLLVNINALCFSDENVNC